MEERHRYRTASFAYEDVKWSRKSSTVATAPHADGKHSNALANTDDGAIIILILWLLCYLIIVSLLSWQALHYPFNTLTLTIPISMLQETVMVHMCQ